MDSNCKEITLVIQTTASEELLPKVVNKVRLCIEKGNTHGYDTVTGPDKQTTSYSFSYK